MSKLEATHTSEHGTLYKLGVGGWFVWCFNNWFPLYSEPCEKPIRKIVKEEPKKAHNLVELGCNLVVSTGITLKEGTVVQILAEFKSRDSNVVAILYDQSGATYVTSVDPELLKPVGTFEAKQKEKTKLNEVIDNFLHIENIRGRTLTTELFKEFVELGIIDYEKLKSHVDKYRSS